MLDFNSLSTPL